MELGGIVKVLPKDCPVGCKRDAKEHTQRWTGYKLHMDTADGGVPISCSVRSASFYDSQTTIPVAILREQQVDNCYELKDTVYDAKEIVVHRSASGRFPIIDPNQRK